ncbi:MAG: DMT family transporter [Marinifilaceae bacterium]
MKTQTRAYFFAITAILCWSTVATAFKLALKGMDFLQLLGIVSGVAALFLLVILLLQGKLSLLKQTTFKDIQSSALLGLLNPFLYYAGLLKAYSLLSAQLALSLNYIWPITLVLLSIPLLKQKIGWKSIIAILISFIGVLVIANKGSFSNINLTNPLGIGLALASSIIWALFWIFNVRDRREDILKLLLNFAFGFVYINIAIALFSDFRIPDSNSLWAAVYIGMVECGLAYVFWLKAMQSTTTTDKISNLVFLSPFISLIFIHLILGENIHLSTLCGLVLIVTGILLQQFIRKKQ